MSKDVTIQIVPRTDTGNGPARRARKSGQVPAVVYGRGKQSQPVMVDEKAVAAVVHHPGLIGLQGAAGTVTGIIKEVQRNPLSGKIIHVDFQEVRADEIITVSVTIEAVGTPAGAIQGGQIEQNMRSLDIKIQAQHIFEVLQVDVSKMELNDVMHVNQLALPEGAVALGDPKAAVFHVRLPKQEEEKPAEGAEGGAEPEVIAKGKKDEEGAEGAAKPGEKAAPKAEEKKK